MPQGETSYCLFDGLGSVVGLTDSSGELVDGKYRYDPFGKQLRAPDFPNPWRYVSGYYDSATGFTKFGTRYYGPDTMRWTQQDPVAGNLGDPITLNRYAYAGCNPVNFTDQSGRNHIECLLANAFAAVAALASIIGIFVFSFPLSVPAIVYTLVTGGFSAYAFLVALRIGCYTSDNPYRNV